MPEIVESDDYESPALFWLYREIKRLDRTLASAGIAEEAKRREICEQYFFDIQDGLSRPVTAGDAYTPLLVLVAADGSHLRATDMFDFHEYALGIVAEYYEFPHPD
jgi:hypothetical protein